MAKGRIHYTVESLFYEISSDWFEKTEIGFESAKRSGLFSFALTVWLMITQRLGGKGMQAALEKVLLEQRGIFAKRNGTSKKLKFGGASLNTGGYSQARKRLEEEEIVSLENHCLKKLEKNVGDTDPVFILDGFVSCVPASKRNVEAYRRHRVKEGEIHYPRIRVLTAHRLSTGIAAIPVHGTLKQSEQELARELLPTLPKGSHILGDRNFGVFTVVYYATNAHHRVLFRLKESIFNCHAGKQTEPHCDIRTQWRVTSDNRKTDPHIPQDASVEGRFIKVTVETPGFRPQALYFFTTLEDSPKELAQLYLQRQHIETQIRNLKRTLKIEFINGKSPAIICKDLHVAFLTYNLLCAIMTIAAKKLGIPVHRVSFTATCGLVEAFAKTALHELEELAHFDQSLLVERFLTAIYQTRLPNRKKPRSYPRVLRRKRTKFPVQAIVNDSQNKT